MDRSQGLGPAAFAGEVNETENNAPSAMERKARSKTRRAKAREQRARAKEQNRGNPLLSLPPELRNRIYEYAVITKHSKIVINSSGAIRNGVPPALLRTCRDIRNEGLPIYFRDKVFVFRICPPNGCHYQLDLSEGLPNYSLRMVIGGADDGYFKSTCCLDIENLAGGKAFLNSHIVGAETPTMDETLLKGLRKILLKNAWKAVS